MLDLANPGFLFKLFLFRFPRAHWLGNEDIARYGIHFRVRDCERNARRTLNRSNQQASSPITLQAGAEADSSRYRYDQPANRRSKSHIALAWLAISLTIYSLPTDSAIRSLWRALKAFVKRRT